MVTERNDTVREWVVRLPANNADRREWLILAIRLAVGGQTCFCGGGRY